MRSIQQRRTTVWLADYALDGQMVGQSATINKLLAPSTGQWPNYTHFNTRPVWNKTKSMDLVMITKKNQSRHVKTRIQYIPESDHKIQK